MSNFLGLPGLVILGERETWDRVYFKAEVGSVVCGKCGQGDRLGDPDQHIPVSINDTPARGRPVLISIDQYKYRCRRCARTFVGMAQEIDTRRQMTRRLIRYIEDNVMRRPRTDIAQEVGIEVDRVKAIALALANRLLHHRFPTPRVLGIDDIRMNGKTYTIFTDSERGHAIGLIETAKRPDIERWTIENLDCNRIAVVASDLASTIAEAVRPALPDAIHVVDRWHVQQACHKAMSTVIGQTVDSLEAQSRRLKNAGVNAGANLPRKQAKAIRKVRADLLGRGKGTAVDQADLFESQRLNPILADHERIAHAFRARIALAKVYQCGDAASAREQLAQFYALAEHPSIVGEMRGTVKRIRRHQLLILNYFGARVRFPDIPTAALTTSSTENRNGKLRKSWKAGRGVTNASYLRMLALYQPWRLDRDILLCSGIVEGKPCRNVEGPVPLVTGLHGQDPDQPVTSPAEQRCTSCRALSSATVQVA